MSRRKLEIRITDTKIGIWQDDANDPSFREEVYSELIRRLRSRRWSVKEDPQVKKHYSCLGPNNRLAAKGTLRAAIEISGRVTSIEFWGTTYPLDNPNGRRYDFDKLQRMTYLDQKRFELEKRRILAWLAGIAETQVNDRDKSHLSTDEWIQNSYDKCWHTKKELGHPDWHADYNRTSRDGELLEQGQTVWFAGRDGRLRRGRAFYNLNSMWWVKVSHYEHTNLSCGELCAQAPADLRTKRNQRKRRERLERLISQAVTASNFRRAELLQNVLFGDQEVYRIWSRKNESFYAVNSCGYCSDGLRAGRFTKEEAEAEVNRVPHILSLVCPDGKHVRFDTAA